MGKRYIEIYVSVKGVYSYTHCIFCWYFCIGYCLHIN